MRDSVRALNRPCWLPGTASRQDDRSFTWSGCVAVAVLAGVPAAGCRGGGRVSPAAVRDEGRAAGGGSCRRRAGRRSALAAAWGPVRAGRAWGGGGGGG